MANNEEFASEHINDAFASFTVEVREASSHPQVRLCRAYDYFCLLVIARGAVHSVG